MLQAPVQSRRKDKEHSSTVGENSDLQAKSTSEGICKLWPTLKDSDCLVLILKLHKDTVINGYIIIYQGSFPPGLLV